MSETDPDNDPTRDEIREVGGEIAARAWDVEQQAADLEARFNEHIDGHVDDELQTRVDALADDLNALRADLTALSNEVGVLTDDVEAVENRVTTLEETDGGEIDADTIEQIIRENDIVVKVLRDLLGEENGDVAPDGGYNIVPYGIELYGSPTDVGE